MNPFALLATGAGCAIIGAIGMAAAFVVWANGHERDEDDDNFDDEDDLQLALNSKVEEAAANRVADAQKMVATMEQSANVLLKAAHTERAAADALTITSKSLDIAAAETKRLSQEVALLRQVCDNIDVQQGQLLSALENFGMLKTSVVRSAATRQVGEPDPNNLPPPLEGGKANPLDAVLR